MIPHIGGIIFIIKNIFTICCERLSENVSLSAKQKPKFELNNFYI